MGMKLFDDGAGDISKIEINQEFARRYEHNKKREDLQRFEEMKKNGVIDSDIGSEDDDESSDDEEDIVNHSSKQGLKFFDALLKVRNKDPSLKDNDAKLFDSDNEFDDDDDNNKKKKKSLYLKDVNATLLLEKGPEFEDEEEIKHKSTYVEEQEALRKEFLDAVGDENEKEDGEDGFLKVKNGKNDEDEDGDEYEKKLNEYFQDEKLDDNEKFLKEYFRNKLWLDRDNGQSQSQTRYLDDKIDISDDEKELERQDEYEQGYNFRHEENAGDRVLGHSRVVENSVRKKDNARKLQRKNKEDRIKQAEFERNEELKHLKNLKKKEINEKVRKIREIAGIDENETCLFDELDLEEEFDPEEHSRMMSKAFDDKFYEAEDVDPNFASEEEDAELKKPDFDEEDEFEKTLKNKVNDEKEGKKRKRKLEEEVIKEELEEYYKLDYEGTIGELKTRFKYRPVNKNNYGLKTKDIIAADPKELNQLIPLKKLATYREEEFVVPYNKIKEHKQRIKSLLKGDKKKLKVEAEKPESEEDNKELSRKQRRKKRLNELKLPTNRLIAYNKIQPKSDKKRKHKA